MMLMYRETDNPSLADVDYITYDERNKRIIATFYGNQDLMLVVLDVPRPEYNLIIRGMFVSGKYDLCDHDAYVEEIDP